MRPLKVRQAAIAGIASSLVLAAVLGARSGAPLVTFLVIGSVGLLVTGVETGVILAMNRRRATRQRR
jgi:hypothetical protein